MSEDSTGCAQSKSAQPAPDTGNRIHQIRRQLFALLVMMASVSFEKSRETSLAYTALQRGRMWTGKVLAGLGEPTPYPKSDDPSSPAIEPQADTCNPTVDLTGDRVADVKWLRSSIGDVTTEIESLGVSSLAYQQVLISLTDARMWLGYELDRIRETTSEAKA